ncbi:winged helix-turn-helix domain-containing protein [Streptomyces sp. NPDC045456]|uniref:winged helix-turn-helix domain-containing protein n=1 Tax=Streptomyces sp. NPDC045456 TaxID=3155254 RepID=UPI0033EC7482
MGERQPRDYLSTVLHSPLRLAILGSLRHVHNVAFADLQEALGLTAPELSRQLRILEDEDIVQVAKARENRRVRTYVRLSDTGRARFEEYLTHLRRVVQEDDT